MSLDHLDEAATLVWPILSIPNVQLQQLLVLRDMEVLGADVLSTGKAHEGRLAINGSAIAK